MSHETKGRLILCVENLMQIQCDFYVQLLIKTEFTRNIAFSLLPFKGPTKTLFKNWLECLKTVFLYELNAF